MPFTFIFCAHSVTFCSATLMLVSFVLHAGGNQRELARQKNAKKQNEGGKGKRNEDGLSAAARKQRYAVVCSRYKKCFALVHSGSFSVT